MCILHSTFYFLHHVSYILHPSSCLLQSASFILYTASYLSYPTSYILHVLLKQKSGRIKANTLTLLIVCPVLLSKAVQFSLALRKSQYGTLNEPWYGTYRSKKVNKMLRADLDHLDLIHLLVNTASSTF